MKKTIILVGILILCSLFASPAAAVITKVPCAGMGAFLRGTWEYKPRVDGDCELRWLQIFGECFHWYNGDIWIKTESAVDIDGICVSGGSRVSEFTGTGIFVELARPEGTSTLEYDAIHTYLEGSPPASSHDLSKWRNYNEILHLTKWYR